MRNFDEFVGIEKEAAPRWRKEWGNLSEASQNRLRKSVASQANETAKRLRGIDAISKKFNVKYRTQSPISKKWRGEKLPIVGKAITGLRNTTNTVREAVDEMALARTSARGNVVTNTLASNKDKFLKGDGMKNISLAGGSDLHQMKYKNRALYDEIASIVGMHEMQEAITKKKKRHISNIFGTIKNNVHDGTYFSHFGPDVLHRESASVATASPEAKKFMKNMRSMADDIDKKSLAAKVYTKKGLPAEAHSELSELKNIGGIDYGKDAVVNKKKMKAHSEAYRKAENILFRNHHKLG